MITIAYYLGQYHELVENNRYWGDGFTEWHNVARARPLFPGHAQPQLPGRFGFYDLTNPSSILAQTEYASSLGIGAFCYWHYWFAGRRVLHRPLDLLISAPDRGLKIMLGWANESWTGIWHGLQNEVILAQTYGREELAQHAKLVASYLQSDRYLRISDASPFLIYKPNSIPAARDYLDEFREHVRRNGGGDLYIIGTWGPGRTQQIADPHALGLDAVVSNNVGAFSDANAAMKSKQVFWHLVKKLGLGPEIRAYGSTVDTLHATHRLVRGTVHSSVVTGWDNTPRTGRRGLVLKGFNAETFENALRVAVALEARNSKSLLFIKSWNEWAEGNTVEPKFHETWSLGATIAKVLKDQG